MRFTTSEEAGNPNTDLVGGVVDCFCIVIEEGTEMSAQLSRDYVFTKFLLEAAFIVLRNLDNTVNVSVYVLLEHIL